MAAVAIVAAGDPHGAVAATHVLPAIGAQPLDEALEQFARTSGLQLAYVANLSSGQRTRGCPAGLTPAQALRCLLEGTGLDFEFINAFTVHIIRRTEVSRLNWVPLQNSRERAAVGGRRNWPERSAETYPTESLDEVTVFGSRSLVARSSTETLVPVDIIDSTSLAGTGQADLAQMLNFVVPSFNSTRQTISDGTDHIDPATLRGLGPDQVLVLVNGKRQHTSALVNVNSTVGRGSVGYDMNTVPPEAIERIEVLRDGAAAQYGSDAIAGVINIVLREDLESNGFSTQYSRTREGDGQTVVSSLSFGNPVGELGGFLNGTLQFSDRDPTDRSGTYNNTVYLPRLPESRYFESLKPEELARQQQDSAIVEGRGFDRNAMVVGNASSRDYRAFFNSAVPVSNQVQVYGFGGHELREGRAAGFYRYPNSPLTRNLQIYPDGYLPFIETQIEDSTLALGAKRVVADGWNLDFSTKFGRNHIGFDVENSLNASLGAQSPTHFDCGELSFTQSTTNIDISKYVGAWGGLSAVNMAFGAEYRLDRYRIEPGEEASWRDYNPAGARTGSAMAPGSQVFFGFRPADQTDETRGNLGLYADFESGLTDRLLLGAATRYENYSDFGSSVSGKLAGRFAISDGFGIRGGLNKGFRAPSLHQKYYSAVATQFITVDGVNQQRQVTTIRNDADIARRLGIPELAPEDSLSYSLGFVASLGDSLRVTVDAYRIDIHNRIVMSGRFSSSIPQLAQYFQGTDITDAQFFTNAIDTRTHGVDAIVTHRRELNNSHVLSVNAAFNYNRTRITDFFTSQQLEGLGETLLNREERGRVEVNQPRDKLILTLGYVTERAQFHIQGTRFGEITTVAPQDPAQDQAFSAKLLTDVSFTYKAHDLLHLTVGANNIFDVYPDRVNDPRLTNDGTVPFSRFATQFGFNGASYFAKLDFKF